MSTNLKRMSLTLMPEWEEKFDTLKREQFYDQTKSDLIRFIIQKGLMKISEEERENK